MNFKDYYKFPLKPMPGLELIKVLTYDNQMAFDWCGKWDNIEKWINQINGLTSELNDFFFVYHDDQVFEIMQEVECPILRIRGWGHLTGIGGLHLSEDKAKEIQDAFGNYIVKQLNNDGDV